MRLSVAEAVLGAKVVIPTLQGKASLKIPPGTRTGDRRVMAGRGLRTPQGQHGGVGHQYVHFEVVIPKGAELSEKGRELMEQFGEEQPKMDEEWRTLRQTTR